MSKTIDLQIEKSRCLINGIRKNLNVLESKGFSNQELDLMASELDKLKVANEQCDAARAELSKKVKECNAILSSVKEKFADRKKTLKGYFPQEEWAKYGVMDKR